MHTLEKTKFIVESLTDVLNSHSAQFKKSNKKLLKSIGDSMDYSRTTNVMTEAIVGSIKVMDEWEDTSLYELDGLTPKQYFESLSTVNEIIELFTLLEEKNGGILPNGLTERVKRLDDVIACDLLAMMESMDLGETKCLNSTQKAAVHIVETLGNPRFINALIKVVSQLDNEKTDEETFTRVMDAIRAIGEPILDPLINLVENGKKKDRLYIYLILTIGKIASGNKSERIYSMLKDYFRNSEKKFVEANALAIYGDGRAIPAIRGYVERNLENLSYWEYIQFKEAVLLLGGNMSDLDEYFDDYDEFDEEDEFYDE